MPRFVVLKHELPAGQDRRTHWDLMLEVGEILQTWALESPPQPGQEIAAQRLADHRTAYLEYEGQVSGDRGWVTRVDEGTYNLEQETPDELVLWFAGRTLSGRARLTQDAADPQRWRLLVEPAT